LSSEVNECKPLAEGDEQEWEPAEVEVEAGAYTLPLFSST
jgi:hypothetical protein